MCTFVLVRVGRHHGAEFAFFPSGASVYIILLCGAKLFCISNVRKASFRTRRPLKQFLLLIL